jgi:hypothetical protein
MGDIFTRGRMYEKNKPNGEFDHLENTLMARAY